MGEHGLGIGMLRGPVDIHDLTSAVDALYTASAWQPDFDACWDGRAVTALVLEPRDTAALLEVIRGLRAQIQRSRAAFVVPRPIDYVVAHMLVSKMRCSEQQHQTFRQLDPALSIGSAA